MFDIFDSRAVREITWTKIGGVVQATNDNKAHARSLPNN
jgi:hypothetical protein